jgi:hypothetical protein
MTHNPKPAHEDSDDHMGAVEGDRPTDQPNQGNRNGPGVDDQGMPNDPIATTEDRIGALVDESEGG